MTDRHQAAPPGNRRPAPRLRRRLALLAGLAAGAGLWSSTAAAAEFDVEKVVAAARSPKPDLVLLSAHRGLWRDAPENTITAMDAAVRAGFESVEIDVRLNGSGTPWLMHDFVLDRLTTATGYLSSWQDEALSELVRLRQRDGTVTELGLNTFAEALDYYASEMTVEDGRVGGFMLVVDLKSPASSDPNGANTSAYAALKASCRVLADKIASTGKPLGDGVIFKLKAREIPTAPEVLEADLKAAGCFDDLLLMAVLHPDPRNAGPGQKVLQAYFDKPYMVGFEAVLEYVGQPNATEWIAALKAADRTVPGFPSWNEYPEGVASSDGLCCVYRTTEPTQVTDRRPLDYSGSFLFHLQVGANWLTADTAPFLNDYLAARGLRDLDQIR